MKKLHFSFVKSLLVALCLFFAVCTVFSQSSYHVAYDIKPNCNRISGNSWRCCGYITVYSDGTVSSVVTTSSNRLMGFSGAMVIQFMDAQQRVIYQVYTPAYGVNGYSSRVDNWTTTIPKEVVAMSSYANVQGVHRSQSKTLKQYTSLGINMLKAYLAGS